VFVFMVTYIFVVSSARLTVWSNIIFILFILVKLVVWFSNATRLTFS